ncbi:unnamed protein product, partial [marine sediment metagenome]
MKNKILSKLMVIAIIGLFIVAGVTQVSATKTIKNDTKNNIISSLPDDNIDQSQYDFSENLYQICSSQSIAQSFKPSLSTLTRVKILLNINATMNPFDIFVHIEDNNMNRIGSTSKRLSNIPNGLNWIEFDFEPDLKLEIGKTYVIVCSSFCSCVNTIGAGYGTNTDYSNGMLYISEQPRPNEDLCFETYGVEEQNESESDLECQGSLSWNEVKPESVQTGTFYIRNEGESDSELDWEIKSYPNWGSWRFTPPNGENLRPSDGNLII